MDNGTTIHGHRCPAFNRTQCTHGIILSIWDPLNEISSADRIVRSGIYFILLCYFFLGVSIIADRFMAGIEMITSQERKYVIKNSEGITETFHIKIWNETVSNLTLMALGSSAPEILLSIIETVGKNFEAGELGPGTIVGSAAFNLFVIIGICVMVVPRNESRKTKHLTVFVVTTIWSLFAYIWLYLILDIISPRIIDVWEAVLTFIFFPITVITAYVADKKFCVKQYLATKVLDTVSMRKERANSSVSERFEPLALKNKSVMESDLDSMDAGSVSSNESDKLIRIKLQYLEIIKQLRSHNKNLSARDLEIMAEIEHMKRKPKSRAYYRRKAMRYLTGSSDPIRYAQRQLLTNRDSDMENMSIGEKQELVFTPDHYTVYENAGQVVLTVTRFGSLIGSTVVELDYYTEDGTAKQGDDYTKVMGTLIFQCGQSINEIVVKIIDDDVYEEDEYFYVKLSNPRLISSGSVLEKSLSLQLGSLKTAVVMILDDDYGGTFHFKSKTISTKENIGNLEIKVIRSSGARGEVRIPYITVSNTAIGGTHYQEENSEIVFKDNQTEHLINIHIFDENEYEKNVSFFVQLKDPIYENKPNYQISGNPKLGHTDKLEIIITENPELKNIINNLINRGKIERIIYTSTWRDQFREALRIGEDNKNEKMPSCPQYVLHYLSLFWKLLFALVPPPSIWNGWLCFSVAIIVIGVLTALIGDVASLFGCHIGLSDSVTAITFVALGTSLPDTFASKVAAINDKTADASIGNVVGSNAVNVFLGIGIAWSIASIYHEVNGGKLVVDSGSLGFSVTLFSILALIAIGIMLLRRTKTIGGELGGPVVVKYATGIFFCLMWLFYVLLSSLEIYCHIGGF